MRKPVRFLLPVLAVALPLSLASLLAGCSGHTSSGMSFDDSAGDGGPNGAPQGGPAPVPDKCSAAQQILRYDANHDGRLSRYELESGLKAEFEAADKNHDGVLELEEYRAVNDSRWKLCGAASSPLADWNGDEVVDFSEFSGAARTLFEQLDVNNDGVLSPQELNPRLKGKKGGDSQQPPQNGPEGGQAGGSGRGPGG